MEIRAKTAYKSHLSSFLLFELIYDTPLVLHWYGPPILMTWNHIRAPAEDHLNTTQRESWENKTQSKLEALRQAWDAKTQVENLGRLEINVRIAESKEGNPLVNTGLSQLTENEGVHTSAEMIECSSLGTKLSPMT